MDNHSSKTARTIVPQQSKQGHRHKLHALVKRNVENVKTLKNSQKRTKTL